MYKDIHWERNLYNLQDVKHSHYIFSELLIAVYFRISLSYEGWGCEIRAKLGPFRDNSSLIVILGPFLHDQQACLYQFEYANEHHLSMGFS